MHTGVYIHTGVYLHACIFCACELDFSQFNPSNVAGIEVPRDCSDLSHTGRRSGVYTIYPYSDRNLSKSVFCEFDSSGNGWTVCCRVVVNFNILL